MITLRLRHNRAGSCELSVGFAEQNEDRRIYSYPTTAKNVKDDRHDDQAQGRGQRRAKQAEHWNQNREANKSQDHVAPDDPWIARFVARDHQHSGCWSPGGIGGRADGQNEQRPFICNERRTEQAKNSLPAKSDDCDPDQDAEQYDLAHQSERPIEIVKFLGKIQRRYLSRRIAVNGRQYGGEHISQTGRNKISAGGDGIQQPINDDYVQVLIDRRQDCRDPEPN